MNLLPSRWIQTIGGVAAIVAFGATNAAGQGTPSYTAPATALTSIRTQIISMPYRVTNASMWWPGQGGFDETYRYKLDKQRIPAGIGGYFDVSAFGADLGEFGAFLGAEIDTQPAIDFRAIATLGTVDVNYPVHVTIEYPDWRDVHGGFPFTIHTNFYTEPGASIATHTPDLQLIITGVLDADIFLRLNARAFGDDILNIDFFNLLGLDDPHLELTKTLVDTGNLLQSGDGPFDIIPNVLYGDFHFPNLDSYGGVGAPDNPLALHAAVNDTFLTLNADITNAVITLLGIPPLNGTYGGSSFGGTFRFLDLGASAQTGIAQNFTFAPRPMVTISTSDGQSVTRPAGEDIVLRMPVGNTVTLTASAQMDNQFTNDTRLQLSPSLTFDPVHVAGHGSVSGIDLFSFDWNPFSFVIAPDSPLDVPLVKPQFAMPGGEPVGAVPYQLSGDNSALHLDSVDPKVVAQRDRDLQIEGRLSGNYNSRTYLRINIGDTAPMIVDRPGHFLATIPQRFVGSVGHVTLTLVTPPPIGHTQSEYSNSVDLVVVPGTLSQSVVQGVDLHQGEGTRIVAGALPIRVDAHTMEFVHTGTDIQDVSPDATLYYDGTPLPTHVIPHQTIAYTREIPTYTTTYDIEAFVPLSLQTAGGSHTIGISNGGIGSSMAGIASTQVENPVPVARKVIPLKGPDHNGDGDSDGGKQLVVVAGSGFTTDSVGLWDGQPRPTKFVSSSELIVRISGGDIHRHGGHRLTVANPAPGGGVSSPLSLWLPAKSRPSVSAQSSLFRSAGGALGDLVTLTNIGQGPIESLSVRSVNLIVGGHEYLAVDDAPATLPATVAGGSNSLIVKFPAEAGAKGVTATIRVSGAADGVPFLLEQSVTLP